MNSGAIQQKNTAKKFTRLKRFFLLLLLLSSVGYITGCMDNINCKRASVNQWGSTTLILQNTGYNDWKDVKITFKSFGVDKSNFTTRKFNYWNANEIKRLEFGDSEFVTKAETCVITVYSGNKKVVRREFNWN